MTTTLDKNQPEKIASPFLLALKGLAMGVAEVIPGVSGGTIAFITGIYERLLLAIKGFDGSLISLLLKGRVKDVWRKVDGNFLLFLLGGMACGVVTGVFVITHLMENVPQLLWAFFFGLILASAWYVGKQVKEWTIGRWIVLLLGLVIAFTVTAVSPVEGSTNLLYVTLSGLLAICALMLPGLSGSFILLLLGMYSIVIGAVKELLTGQGMDKIVLILCFIIGMVIGLIAFSRVLTWMFKHYRLNTLALLAGFMLGSLPKVWPWRIPTLWMDADGVLISSGSPGEHARILSEKIVMPGSYTLADPHTAMAVGCFALGVLIIIGAMWFESRSTNETA